MVKHYQTIRRLLSVFDHFAELALKGVTRQFQKLTHFVPMLQYISMTSSILQHLLQNTGNIGMKSSVIRQKDES